MKQMLQITQIQVGKFQLRRQLRAVDDGCNVHSLNCQCSHDNPTFIAGLSLARALTALDGSQRTPKYASG
jgi:hypothetical protein